MVLSRGKRGRDRKREGKGYRGSINIELFIARIGFSYIRMPISILVDFYYRLLFIPQTIDCYYYYKHWI